MSEEPATSSSATSSGNNSSPATPYEHDPEEKQKWEGTREKEMSETRKLQVIIEEFGEMTTLMETLDGKPAESERIIAESHGSLYRSVPLLLLLGMSTDTSQRGHDDRQPASHNTSAVVPRYAAS